MTWRIFLTSIVLLFFFAATLLAQEGESPSPTPSENGSSDSERTEHQNSLPQEEVRTRTIHLGAQLALASTYVFRGELQYGSPVIPSFQPSVWLDFSALLPGTLQFTVWSAIAMADREHISRIGSSTETDLVLFYKNSVLDGWLELAGGFLYYTYPGEGEVDGEKELLLVLGVGNLPLEPSIALYFEVHPDLALQIEPSVSWKRWYGNFTVGMELMIGASVSEGGDSSVDYTRFSAMLAQDSGRLTFEVSLSYVLRISPVGLDFLDRSLLFGMLSLSAS